MAKMHVVAVVAGIAWLAGAGCSNRAEAPDFAQLYTTRGIVQRLPGAGPNGSELSIQHEEIPEFVNGAGEIVGMRSMTMPFPKLLEDVSLDGIEVGDKVRFTFGVEWEQGPTTRVPVWTVTAIEELPADTVLEVGRPPAAAPAEPETPQPAPEGE